MPQRVLVVDDEEAIRALVKDFLEGAGYAVTCAADGDEGIKAFRSSAPHVVLIDFLLPKKNGFAVAEAIRKDEQRAQTPIIMMSGVFKNPKTAVEAREKYRVVDFLSKPLDMERVAHLVRQAAGDSADDGPAPGRSGGGGARGSIPPPSRSGGGRGGSVSYDDAMNRDVPDDASLAAALEGNDESPAPRGLSYFSKPSDSMAGNGRARSAPQPTAPDPPARGGAGGARKAPLRMSSAEVESGVFNGRPFPELGDEGELDQIPVAMLLSTIRYDSITGMLDLTDQGTHRRIYIVRGQPTFMQSNAEGENVGALLLRRGRITEPDFQRCLTYMKAKGRTLQQSLLELRLANEHDLSTAYKLLAGQLMPLALGMSSGRFKWRETDAFIGRVPEGNFEPVQVLFEGIKRHVHPPQILKFFKGREDVPMMKTAEFDRLMPFFRRAFSANNLGHEISSKVTYRELTRKHANQVATVIPQLFALVTSGMVILPDISEDNLMDVAVNAAAAEIAVLNDEEPGSGLAFEDDGDDDEHDLTPEERRARAAIARYHDEIMGKDFFQIFGADRDADNERIKALYFELAKRWHADTYAEMRLGAVRPKLDAIFARITEAYETITDRGKREEYLVYLDRAAKGLPTDVNQILRGEQLFDQANAMIRRRDFAGAKPVLEEAIRMNPGDPLYYASLGWVIFNMNQKATGNVTEAVQHLKRAVQESENCPLAYQYLGQIAFARGQVVEAKKWWSKCLEWEPNNIEASRGLRMLSSREEKDKNQKSGLLGKLLNKK